MSRPNASRARAGSAPRVRNPLRPVAVVLLGLAAALSLYLATQSLSSGAVPGCDAGDCAAVLASKWSKIYGVPVGLFGAAAYAVLGLLGSRPLPATEQQRGPRVIAAALALLIVAAALWFGSLQAFVLRAFCPWCTATHGVAVVGATLMALSWRRDRTARSAAGARKGPRPLGATAVWGPAAGIAGAAFAGFVAVQALSPEPPPAQVITATMAPEPMNAAPAVSMASTSAPATGTATAAAGSALDAAPADGDSVGAATASTGKTLSLHGGRFQIEAAALPMSGRPDAEHLVVMISDYKCRYCRAAHRTLKPVRAAFDPGELGFIHLPSHNGGESEEIQRLMLSAWKADPEAWAEVGDALYSEAMPITPEAVRAALAGRIGEAALEESLRANRAWVDRLFAMSRQVYEANRAVAGKGSIPQFIIGREIVVGAPADAADFFGLLEKHAGLARRHYPTLELARDDIDLGRVFAGTQHAITVTYSNGGDAPLQIARASVPRPGSSVRGLEAVVPPGESASLEMRVVTPRDAGPFEDVVTLFSNARTNAKTIRITGVSFKPLTITPPLLEFGVLDVSQTATQGVMRVEFEEEARIESVRSQNPNFAARIQEVTPGRVYEVVVETKDNLTAGAHQAALLLHLAEPTPAGWPKTIAVGARAKVESAVTVVPPKIIVPPGALPNESHHHVMVRCGDGTEGFKVTGAVLEGGPGGVLPEVKAGPGTNTYIVQLSFPAGWSLAREANPVKLIITTTHPRFGRLEAPVEARP